MVSKTILCCWKKWQHDLRPYVDAGACVVEFLYKYISHSGDLEILEEKLPWLDSEKIATIREHLLKIIDYYLCEDNIGEHGLCKIRGGDWLDAANLVGIEGRGESVMLTCQVIISLYYIKDLCNKLGIIGVEKYETAILSFKDNINKWAINKNNYYNGMFNDDGNWIFSACDPDGRERPYGPANWYAIASVTTKKENLTNVLKVMQMLKCDYGYRLFYPPFGDKPIDKVGRCASGDVPAFMGENGNVYSHGSQGFLARALAKAGRGNELFDVVKWMLPCYQEKHPTNEVMTAPYAIVNCWQELPSFKHRGMLSFLTGSVAMCLRSTIEWIAGIDVVVDGLELLPCIPDEWDNMYFSTVFRNRKVDIYIQRNSERTLTVNGVKIKSTSATENRYFEFYKVSADLLCKEQNMIVVTV